MTDLSPAAQAVLDAFFKAPMGQSYVDDDLNAIAAALRANGKGEYLLMQRTVSASTGPVTRCRP